MLCYVMLCYVMLFYLMVIHPISLSIMKFWNEDEWTYEEAIFTVATRICQCNQNHQAKPSFRGKLPSFYGMLSTQVLKLNYLN